MYYHGDKKCPCLVRIDLMIIYNVEKNEATSIWFLNFSYCHISSDFEWNLFYVIVLCQSKLFWMLSSAPLNIFWLVQYVKEFLVCHKRFGPVLNMLESVEGWGISIGPNLFWAGPKIWGINQKSLCKCQKNPKNIRYHLCINVHHYGHSLSFLLFANVALSWVSC